MSTVTEHLHKQTISGYLNWSQIGDKFYTKTDNGINVSLDSKEIIMSKGFIGGLKFIKNSENKILMDDLYKYVSMHCTAAGNKHMSINAKSIQSFEYTQILQFLSNELKYDITTTNKIWIQLTGEYKSNSYGVIWIEGLMRYIDDLVDSQLESNWNMPMHHALNALHDELGQINDNILIYYP